MKKDLLNSTMSLGDHLEELRLRLILALTGIAICAVVCLFFGAKIIAFIEKPYTDVMGTEARLQTLAPADGRVDIIVPLGLLSIMDVRCRRTLSERKTLCPTRSAFFCGLVYRRSFIFHLCSGTDYPWFPCEVQQGRPWRQLQLHLP